ncbi:MAG: ParB/RepB/Spo0J family partition protein [Treponema sp.]|nr:ParB/RepB/Spo0J family partition protein [Treponema sp.]
MAPKTPKHGLGRGMEALMDDMNSGMEEQELPLEDEADINDAGEEDAGISLAEIASLKGLASEDKKALPPRAKAGKTLPETGQTETGTEHAADIAPAVSPLLVPLSSLKPNPGQPRKHFDEESLRELADSIREHGIIQPIIAENAGDGSYIIIAGERRSRAAALAGLAEVPVILRSYPELERLEISLIENVQREDLNPIEEASAYKTLMEISGLSQEEAALRVGKNRSTVANALRLLKLPVPVQESLAKGELSSGHARAILMVNQAEKQALLFREILSKSLSVREAEKQAAALNGENGKKTPQKGEKPARRAPELDAMEEKFISALGTKVVIDGDLNKGLIHIDYYSMEDLERLYEILG